MEIKVVELYDMAKVAVPRELASWRMSREEVDSQLALLGRLSAREVRVDTAETGDSVLCGCDGGGLSGRTVILYPGLGMPGVEAEEKAVLGRKAGGSFASGLGGGQTLTVEKILRRLPVAVDDALVRSQGIDGVNTVAEYRDWFRAFTEENNRNQAPNQIKSYILGQVAENSRFEMDEAEVSAWTDQQVAMAMASMESAGAEMAGGEDMLPMLREQCIQRLKQEAVMHEICRVRGIVFTPDMFEQELRELQEQMPGMEDMMDEYREMLVGNAYMDKVWELMDPQVQTALEVEA